MPIFNTSTRKEDISLKLRAQHLNKARDQTKKLEEDNRKMEERLKELKTLMRREKELREKPGSGFWTRGQQNTGSLTNYASDVLQNKATIIPAEGKIKKVKVLRDEPIEKPKQIGPPGILKYITQRKLPIGTVPKDKQKGPKCGQCEERTATVSCVQCSEIYCPGCFAAFHLKGALKQHRSVPLSAAGPRVCMSQSTSEDSQIPRGGQASGLIPVQENINTNGSEAAGASSANPHTNSTIPTLLQGDYDESHSAASFQAAVLAWRQGEEPEAISRTDKRMTSPAIVVDESIGTSEESKIPEIKFKSSLSYAEKLMLKKHLRMKLAQASPKTDSSSKRNLPSQHILNHPASQESPLRSISRLHSQGSFFRGQAASFSDSDTRSATTSRTDFRGSTIEHNTDIENINTGSSCGKENENSNFRDEDDAVDFLSLFEAVKSSKSPQKMDGKCGQILSDISITDLFPRELNPSEVPGQIPSLAYTIKEVSPMESWKTEHLQTSEAPKPNDDSNKSFTSKFYSHHSYHHSQRGINSELCNPASKTLDITPPVSVNSHQNHQGNSIISDLPPAGRKLFSKSESNQQTNAAYEHQLKKESDELENFRSHVNLEVNSSKSCSGSRSDRSHSRSLSSKSSRPSSTARLEGHLTKAPSEGLRIVAQMARCSQHLYSFQSQLEDFFLIGVDGSQPVQVENTLMCTSKSRAKTPRTERQGKESVKISNKLYQMSPRSWHPSSSLSPASLLNEVKSGEKCEGITLSYSYGKDKSGQGIEWLQSSNQNILDKSSSDPVLDASISRKNLTQKTSGQGECDIDSEISENGDKTPSSTSRQFFQTADSHKFHKMTTPVSGHGIHSNFKIVPVPPKSKLDHRLSSEVISSTSIKSNKNTNFTNNDQNAFKSSEQSDDKSGTVNNEETLKQSRQNMRSPKTTSKNSSLFQHGKHTSRVNQILNSLNTAVSHEHIKTMYPETLSSKTVLVQNQSLDYCKRDLKHNLSQSRSGVKSDQRPNSSTVHPTQNAGQELRTSSGTPRPSSSSVTIKPLRKTQPDLQSTTDSVVAEMMKSRVQEDGWVDEDLDFSYDYDDGDNLTPEALHLRVVAKLNNKKCEKWETEVRPFSGLSLGSGADKSHTMTTSARSEIENSRSTSYRSVSVASHKSGRISRAIVIDGDDLSCYDIVDTSREQAMEDKQALEQLEWELASCTGRLTAEGKISHLNVHENGDVASSPSLNRSLKIISEKDYDIAARILADEKQSEKNVDNLGLRMDSRVDDVNEVRALR